jgi:hypothetical protein
VVIGAAEMSEGDTLSALWIWATRWGSVIGSGREDLSILYLGKCKGRSRHKSEENGKRDSDHFDRWMKTLFLDENKSNSKGWLKKRKAKGKSEINMLVFDVGTAE